MAKHLSPFKHLKGLLLAICFSILAALPAAATLPPVTEGTTPALADIKVTKDNIHVVTGQYVYLNRLIQAGIVKGIEISEWQNYVPSSESSRVVCDKTHFSVSSISKDPYVITYTNIKNPDVKFELTVVALYSPCHSLTNYTITEGVKKQFGLLREIYMPLSEYESIDVVSVNGQDADSILILEVDTISNMIGLIGLKSGDVQIRFYHPYCDTKWFLPETVNVHVGENTSTIKVKSEKYFFPYTKLNMSLEYLVLAGEIEGLPIDECKNYIPSCDDSSLVIIGGSACSVQALEYKDYSVLYTNSEDPNITFRINYSVQKCFDRLIGENADPVYVGDTKMVSLTDEYLPLSEFTSFEVLSVDGFDPGSIADIKLDLQNNEITITGVREGTLYLFFNMPLLNGNLPRKWMKSINIVERPEEVEPELDADGEGEILTTLYRKVKVVVPKEIAEAAGGQPIIWKSSNEGIATVDENGIVSPSALGLTILTASIESTASRAPETVLMTLEFWVTDLIAEVPETISVGSKAQASYTVDAGEDSYNKGINPEWSSSDPSVVLIDEDGKMTGIAEGTATITLKTDIGTKSVVVNVEPDDTPAGKLSINPSHVALTVGGRIGLSTEGSGGKTVKWTTSNSFAATVSETGVVTAVGVGSAVITATVEGTSLKASANVTVFERTTGIEAADTAEPVITAEDLTVIISGVAADIPVEIYNVSGRLIAARKGSCSVAVGQSGIYIVRIGGSARKVAVNR